MQFIALASDLTVSAETQDKYVHVGEVQCPTCSKAFQLWAPFLETEQTEVDAQRKWLSEFLAKRCAEHIDVFFTPDRPR
jgi:hypothetical protein